MLQEICRLPSDRHELQKFENITPTLGGSAGGGRISYEEFNTRSKQEAFE